MQRPLGSILHTQDAQAGHAFTSDAARLLYERRRAAGWGVDPLRIGSYLTSSQALMINLLGPLERDGGWAANVFATALRQPLRRAIKIDIEYAPARRSLYLGDMTRIDALLWFETISGETRAVALEVKLADRWSSRYLDLDAGRYLSRADALGHWRTDEGTFRDRRVNQLVRCHLLASMVAADVGVSEPTPMVILALEEDRESAEVVGTYRRALHRPDLVQHVDLAGFIQIMGATANTAQQQRLSDDLHIRYADLHLSAPPPTGSLPEVLQGPRREDPVSLARQEAGPTSK